MVVRMARFLYLHADNYPGNPAALDARGRTAEACGVGNKTVTALCKGYRETQIFEKSVDKRGKYERLRLNHRAMKIDIRELLHTLNAGGSPVSSNIVRQRMVELWKVNISTKSINRILKGLGFSWANASAGQSYTETLEIHRKRSEYLRARMEMRTNPTGEMEMWLDETYCNQHHVQRKT
ncbi:uncharacterized protein EV422DRAFT_154971 [Fimicolochytrium jonesii]|uniref:uncharacterized protein n=1 Tax=Fimicolochytrium jonesii TaxID=1396493 RepID=UPI0022FE5B28|nr:uncharacterized protein EV422DRAFT_154971 [Fimicolochytrium jonesii]KAI8826131.1 hypothetical protein EV422DRAFT_154971 [Fimicolochytrium jonesii]